MLYSAHLHLQQSVTTKTHDVVMLFLAVSISIYGPDVVVCHGRLVEPPARSSMWRFGFHTPVNYDDNALNCGGFDNQWHTNGGQCGACGDPFQGPRDHEAGGKYALGMIGRTYRPGSLIWAGVQLTTSHLGWFEFRLCVNNDPRRPVTKTCLDSNLLRMPGGATRYYVRSFKAMTYNIPLQLPQYLTCTQCVLQWKYNTGNSWGCDGLSINNRCCMGCGKQEQFYGCADIAIGTLNTVKDSNSPRIPNQSRLFNFVH